MNAVGSVDIHGIAFVGRGVGAVCPAMTLAFNPADMAEATTGRGMPSRSDIDGASGAGSLRSAGLNDRLVEDSIKPLRLAEKTVRLGDMHLLVVAAIDLKCSLVRQFSGISQYNEVGAHLSELVCLADVVELDFVALHVVVAFAAYDGVHGTRPVLEGNLNGCTLGSLILDADQTSKAGDIGRLTSRISKPNLCPFCHAQET